MLREGLEPRFLLKTVSCLPITGCQPKQNGNMLHWVWYLKTQLRVNPKRKGEKNLSPISKFTPGKMTAMITCAPLKKVLCRGLCLPTLNVGMETIWVRPA